VHGFTAGPLRDQVDNLEFAPAQGFMKGFIDLVFEAHGRFYVVDYKSNWLGTDPHDYQERRLPAVMADNAYYLQYLVYTVALHRYLRLRLPGYDYHSHFGGVFYLFLRGMGPELGPDFGIYRDRPDRALVEALDAYIERGELSDPAGTTGGAVSAATLQ
jgi:exodeoxyribonuclease V beta subunit